MCECCGGDCKLCKPVPDDYAKKMQVLQQLQDLITEFQYLHNTAIPYDQWPEYLKLAE